jgi:mitochondrial fission protein ELM1
MQRLPTRLNPGARGLLSLGSDSIEPPWPDLWIGNGRAAIPLSIAVRRWSSGRTFVVQLQDPLRAPRLFDLVIPPNHDGLRGANVFGITGTPHRVTPERLAESRAQFAAAIDRLPQPRIAALIGGKSKAFGLSPPRARTLAGQIAAALRASGGSLLLTFSRRTPVDAKAILEQALGAYPGMIWDGEGPNPYFAFLATADYILVTEDSANMPAEAAATGKPVYLLKMDGAQARKRRFHAELADLGIARPFEGVLEPWSYPPLRETERAAREVLRRMADWPGSA